MYLAKVMRRSGLASISARMKETSSVELPVEGSD